MTGNVSSVPPFVEFDLNYARSYTGIIGVDEAGRGCLAGPVSTAAVYIKKEAYLHLSKSPEVKLIDDSKKVSPKLRESLRKSILAWSQEGLISIESAFVGVEEIESLNILGATCLGMNQCLEKLNATHKTLALKEISMPLWENTHPTNRPLILVDGIPLKRLKFEHTAVKSADAKSLAVAMASIIAKTGRDQALVDLDKEYPQYELARHKGYGTQAHRQLIIKHGPSAIHRPSFLNKIFTS